MWHARYSGMLIRVFMRSARRLRRQTPLQLCMDPSGPRCKNCWSQPRTLFPVHRGLRACGSERMQKSGKGHRLSFSNKVGQVMKSSLLSERPTVRVQENSPRWKTHSSWRQTTLAKIIYFYEPTVTLIFTIKCLLTFASCCSWGCLILYQEGALLSGNRRFLLLTGERSACPPGAELLQRLPCASPTFALQNARCSFIQQQIFKAVCKKIPALSR